MNAPGSAPRSLGELLATYTVWSGHDTLAAAARRAEASGELERAAQARELLVTEPVPSASEALAAQHELASLLAGWRWQTVAAARDQGAGWGEIGAATGTDADTARAEYATELERVAREAERAGIPLPAVELERYHAATTDNRYDGGDADRSDTDRGDTDRGDTDRGDTDRGDTDRGDTDAGVTRDRFGPGEDLAAGDEAGVRDSGPVPDHALVSGQVVLPGGLPPDDHDQVGDQAGDRHGEAAGPVVVVPTQAALERVADRFDQRGWGADQARAWEYLARCRELCDEHAAATASGDRATGAVVEADQAWLDQAYRDHVVPPEHIEVARGQVSVAEARRFAHAMLGLERADATDTAVDTASVPEPRRVEGSLRWPVPDPALAPEALSDRELVARAQRHGYTLDRPTSDDHPAAREALEATRVEAERRAQRDGPESAAAQVAGYLALVAEDREHALAAEADQWRGELDDVLPGPVLVDAAPDDPGWQRRGDAARWRPQPAPEQYRAPGGEQRRAALAAYTRRHDTADQSEQQRAEQLATWHRDDHHAGDHHAGDHHTADRTVEATHAQSSGDRDGDEDAVGDGAR